MTIDPRLIPLRDELADRMLRHVSLGTRAQADFLLATDGPLWPLLWALGNNAWNVHEHALETWGRSRIYNAFPSGFSRTLADACLAAAEVEP